MRYRAASEKIPLSSRSTGKTHTLGIDVVSGVNVCIAMVGVFTAVPKSVGVGSAISLSIFPGSPWGMQPYIVKVRTSLTISCIVGWRKFFTDICDILSP
jgi:hypothetical protein